MNSMITTSAGTVCYHDELTKKKFLLVHQKSGDFWGFPKGHVEYQESRQNAALRETKEETGIESSIVEGFERRIFYRTLEEKEVFFFLAKARSTQITVDPNEILEAAWLRYEDARKLIRFDDLRRVLDDAVHFLNL